MVLESLVNPFSAERRPWELFFIGFIYTSVAIFLSLWVFKSNASLVAIFLVVLACIPFVMSTIKFEQEKESKYAKEWPLLKDHSLSILCFMFLFAGITFSMMNWYIFLPSQISANLFSVQTKTLLEINGGATAHAVNFGSFYTIFLNQHDTCILCEAFS